MAQLQMNGWDEIYTNQYITQKTDKRSLTPEILMEAGWKKMRESEFKKYFESIRMYISIGKDDLLIEVYNNCHVSSLHKLTLTSITVGNLTNFLEL